MRPAMTTGGTSSEIKIIKAICPIPTTSNPWSPPTPRPARDNEAEKPRTTSPPYYEFITLFLSTPLN